MDTMREAIERLEPYDDGSAYLYAVRAFFDDKLKPVVVIEATKGGRIQIPADDWELIVGAVGRVVEFIGRHHDEGDSPTPDATR